jgi:hypothetical protein
MMKFLKNLKIGLKGYDRKSHWIDAKGAGRWISHRAAKGIARVPDSSRAGSPGSHGNRGRWKAARRSQGKAGRSPFAFPSEADAGRHPEGHPGYAEIQFGCEKIPASDSLHHSHIPEAGRLTEAGEGVFKLLKEWGEPSI